MRSIWLLAGGDITRIGNHIWNRCGRHLRSGKPFRWQPDRVYEMRKILEMIEFSREEWQWLCWQSISQCYNAKWQMCTLPCG